jgi:cyclic pyranopterin phosphate synthase
MPEGGVRSLAHEDIMRYEDILLLCSVLSGLGVRKIRFTGGEPLVRKGLIPFLLDFKSSFPDISLSLTTNATLLGGYSGELALAGLSGINISLDTLDPEKFRSITRVGDISSLFAGIAAAVDAGIQNIKTNTVLMRGFNDDELTGILSRAWSMGILPRLIEFMPLGDDVWRSEMFIGADEILERLTERYGELRPVEIGDSGTYPRGPAKYYTNAFNQTVGIIAAVSNHFCSTCNRLRVTASGHLRSCLFSKCETPLIELLRSGDSASVKEAILDGINAKPVWWEQERDGLLQMSNIGG